MARVPEATAVHLDIMPDYRKLVAWDVSKNFVG
jgi:hypothetical protein